MYVFQNISNASRKKTTSNVCYGRPNKGSPGKMGRTGKSYSKQFVRRTNKGGTCTEGLYRTAKKVISSYIEQPQNLDKRKSRPVVHESTHIGYITKNRKRVPRIEELEMISSRDPDAELVKVFLHKSEKYQLKELAAERGIPVSHLMRALALQWVEQSDETL